MKKKIALGCLGGLLLVFSVGLAGIYHYGPRYNIHLLPPSPQRYGQIALEQIEQFGLYAQGQEWKKVKESTLHDLATSSSYENSLEILKPALKLAGGKHSFFLSADQLKASSQSSQLPTSQLLDGGILHLRLPDILTDDREILTNYAETLQTAFNRPNLIGVIIDLRDNRGGNMYPMLAGLSSLLPKDNLFSFAYRSGEKQAVSLNEVSNWSGLSLSKQEHHLPIAILLNAQTASSGEIVAMSFQGLDKVRFFGQPTAGYTTSNQNFPLYDGTGLVLTTSRLVSRTGQVYDNDPIQPDVETDTPQDEAINWLMTGN